jgi:hypothetical protein
VVRRRTGMDRGSTGRYGARCTSYHPCSSGAIGVAPQAKLALRTNRKRPGRGAGNASWDRTVSQFGVLTYLASVLEPLLA